VRRRGRADHATNGTMLRVCLNGVHAACSAPRVRLAPLPSLLRTAAVRMPAVRRCSPGGVTPLCAALHGRAGRPDGDERGHAHAGKPHAQRHGTPASHADGGIPRVHGRMRRPLRPARMAKDAIKERLEPKAAAVVEDVCTLPNMLTVGRICLSPAIGWAVATHHTYLGLGLLGIAGFSDLLDGWIARHYQSKTVFGSVADPAADKVLMTTMVIALAAGGQMPLPLAALILGRDAFLVGKAFIIRWRSLPPPRTFSRYFDPRLPTVVVAPTRISKFNTFLQLLLVGTLTLYPVLPEGIQTHPHTTAAVNTLMGIVAFTTLWTGVDYARSNSAVRFLHKR